MTTGLDNEQITELSKDANFYDDLFNTGNVSFNANEYFSNPSNCHYCVIKGSNDLNKKKGCTKHNGDKKGTIHYEAKKVMKNPNHLFLFLGINFENELKKINMDPKGKKIIYNTCILSNCLNCVQRRTEKIEIEINDKKYSIKFCWSPIKDELNTICIGFHINYIFDIVNNKIIKDSIKIDICDIFKYNKNKNTRDIPLVEPLEEPTNSNRNSTNLLNNKQFPQLGNGKVSTNQNWTHFKPIISSDGLSIDNETDNEFSPTKEYLISKSHLVKNDENNSSFNEASDVSKDKPSDVSKDKPSDVSKDKPSDKLENLKKENQVLIKEIGEQKKVIDGLRLLIQMDNKIHDEEKDTELINKNKKLVEENRKLLIDNNRKDKDIKNLKFKNEDLECSGSKLTEKDKQELHKDCKNVSSVIFNAILNHRGYK